ncbi:phenylacetate--CoA ligase family protein [Planococcus sp. YIM B11945]|uniref:phenylacetate--CoA ligase family protein n=1 Tax=Planococcus sp. YIM B11945 TaxID=3435410 RepID=UPI003D7EAE27
MSKMQMKIYNYSPIPVQNLLTMIDGYRKGKNRYGSEYYSVLKELDTYNYGDMQVQQAYQLKEMRRLIRHAKKNSPFYQEFYAGIDVESIQTLEDLKKLPVLEKAMVRNNGKKMFTISEEEGVSSSTSGTTGTPQKVIFTKNDFQKRMAYLDHFKKQHGVINLEMRRASFSDQQFVPQTQKSSIYWRDNLSAKQRLYSAFHCQTHTAEYLAQNLNEYKPEFIDGLPSSIYAIAQWINQNNFQLSYRPIAIFPSGETLYPHYREEIEMAFGCPVRDQYASSEGAPFIIECPSGNLHYHLMTGIIETMPDGKMLVTCFHTYGTPLIRYEVGDVLEWEHPHKTCECGSAHPLVKSLKGRTNDYLISKKGERFTGVYMAVNSEWVVRNVQKIQYIQHDEETIETLIEVVEGNKNLAVEAVRDKLEYLFGDEMNLIIRTVDQIPPQRNGKHRLIINHLAQQAGK